MITIRRSDQRGHAQHGWLDSYHSFSFADYYDPQHMGFRGLRVINEDFIAPGKGFGKHPHRDMEIISYVVEGALEHQDSMGNGSVMRPGDVQRMSAGTGVAHSEFNASQHERVHLLQIWLVPGERGIEPSYEQKHFADPEKQGKLRLVASPRGDDGSVTIHTDARLYAGLLASGDRTQHELAPGRHAWIQVVRGRVRVNGEELGAGDGAALSDVRQVELECVDAAELLLFDLA